MSKFEVIRGVEGYCLALDETRIAGPKPWGGGTVICEWETDKEYKAVDTQREDKALDMLLNMLTKYDELHAEFYDEEDRGERKSLMRQRNALYVQYLGACAAFDLAFDLEHGTMDSCAKAVYEHRNLY